MSHISFFPYRWSPLASCKIVQLQCCTIVSLLAIYYKHTLNESCMPYTFRIYLLIIFTMHDTQDLRLYVVEKRVYFPHWCIALNLSLHLSNTESKYFEKKWILLIWHSKQIGFVSKVTVPRIEQYGKKEGKMSEERLKSFKC